MTEAPREDRRQQPKPPKTQLLKSATAAQKLGIYLPATPAEFQESFISRDELQALIANPPEWLATLRREGPHPRAEVARRLGVSNSALARAGVSDHLTSVEIRAIIDEQPEWLLDEREKHAPGTGRRPGTAVGERPTAPESSFDDEDDEYDESE